MRLPRVCSRVLTVVDRPVWLAPIVTLMVSSAFGDPGLAGTRQVFLSSSPSLGSTYSSEYLVGTHVDRFHSRDTFGYVYIVFNGGTAHVVQFAIKDAGTAVYASPQWRLDSNNRVATWRGDSFAFPIAGKLDPGSYVLHLTIDSRPAGTYPFRVDDGR